MYPDFSFPACKSAPTSALILENFGFAQPIHSTHTHSLNLQGFPVTVSSTAKGTYHSLITENIWQAESSQKVRCLRVLSDILSEYIDRTGICRQNFRILVCGLGNGDITSDALGNAVCKLIPSVSAGNIGGKELYIFCPGVPARTGIPTDTLIRAVAERMHADLLITVDSLCARSLSRLASVIQVTDEGVLPGSGTTDTPQSGEISTRTMPCPVLTVGVPTVISSVALVQDVIGRELPDEKMQSFPVSHTAIDSIVHGYSEILAGAITRTILSSL